MNRGTFSKAYIHISNAPLSMTASAAELPKPESSVYGTDTHAMFQVMFYVPETSIASYPVHIIDHRGDTDGRVTSSY